MKTRGQSRAKDRKRQRKVTDAGFDWLQVEPIVSEGGTGGDPIEGIGGVQADQQSVGLESHANRGILGQGAGCVAVGEPGSQAVGEPGVEVGLAEGCGPGVGGAAANASELGEEGVLKGLGLLGRAVGGGLVPPRGFALGAGERDGQEHRERDGDNRGHQRQTTQESAGCAGVWSGGFGHGQRLSRSMAGVTASTAESV